MATYGRAPRGEELIGQFELEDKGIFEFKLYPQLWGNINISNYYNAKAWTPIAFQRSNQPTIPESSGIYMFVVAPRCGNINDHSYIFYVGQTLDLRRRFGDYLTEQKGRGPNPRKEVVQFLSYFKDYLFFYYTVIPSTELDDAENLLKDNFTPPANKQVSIRGRL